MVQKLTSEKFLQRFNIRSGFLGKPLCALRVIMGDRILRLGYVQVHAGLVTGHVTTQAETLGTLLSLQVGQTGIQRRGARSELVDIMLDLIELFLFGGSGSGGIRLRSLRPLRC